MNCPLYKQEYVGVCIASKTPYVPTIAERNQFCSGAGFSDCPLFRSCAGNMLRRRTPDGRLQPPRREYVQ